MISLLWSASALNLVPAALTPVEALPVVMVSSTASQWTPGNVAEQLTPAAAAQALAPSQWATPQAVIPDAIRGLAIAAVLAVMA
jgi:hypothetical protein